MAYESYEVRQLREKIAKLEGELKQSTGLLNLFKRKSLQAEINTLKDQLIGLLSREKRPDPPAQSSYGTYTQIPTPAWDAANGRSNAPKTAPRPQPTPRPAPAPTPTYTRYAASTPAASSNADRNRAHALQLVKLQHAYQYIMRICNIIMKSPLGSLLEKDDLLRRAVHGDVLRYMLYLTHSDGVIDKVDALYIKYALDEIDSKHTEQDYQSYYTSLGIHTATYQTAPLIALPLFMNCDEALRESNPGFDENETARIYLCVLNLMGNLLLDDEAGVEGNRSLIMKYLHEQYTYLDHHTGIPDHQGIMLAAEDDDLSDNTTFYRVNVKIGPITVTYEDDDDDDFTQY